MRTRPSRKPGWLAELGSSRKKNKISALDAFIDAEARMLTEWKTNYGL